jgi:galactokinase
MDQAVIACAVADHALLIDCRDLTTTAVPLPPGAAVVVLDTATRRGLVDSKYNERRQQCEAAARFFGVELLRDVDAATFAAAADQLDALPRARARHVINENARTCEAAAALLGGDVVRFGQLMNESHASLRDDFEVTNHELDVIVSAAQEDAACFGARMTGAGFGGCAVALVEDDQAERFIADVNASYQDSTGLHPHAYICRPAAGANWVALD